MATEALPRPYEHSGPDTFADIFQVPSTLSEKLEKAYERVPRAPLNYGARRLVRNVLTASAEALRTGRAAFDHETEAELVAHLAADDFLAGESVQWSVERLNALRKSVPLTPHATMFLQAISFWRGDMETVRNVDAESPYACGHKRTVAAGLELARAGDFLAAEKELTGAIGLAYFPISDQWHRIDFPILLVLLVCKVRANGGGNMASLKKLLRVLPDAACQSGAADDYAGNSDLRRDATWIVHFAATLPGVECYSVAERGGKLLVLSCEMTKASGDQGVDLIVVGGGKKIAVQCKLYAGAVGNDAVQQVMAGRVYYGCDVACVVTNSTFTKSAKDLAVKTEVELLHYEKLLDFLKRFQEGYEKRKALLSSRGKQIMGKLAEFQKCEAQAKMEGVDTLLRASLGGIVMERTINDEIDQYKNECKALGLEVGEIGRLRVLGQSKIALIDLAKKGDAKAKTALFELIRGRNVAPYVADVLQKALKNKEKWVEPMRAGLGIYGIGVD